MEDERPPPSHAKRRSFESANAESSDELPTPTASIAHAGANADAEPQVHRMQGKGEQLDLDLDHRTPFGTDGQHHIPNGHIDPDSAADDAPPFWSRHGRSVSAVSYHSITASHQRPLPILLEDRSDESTHEAAQGCWAQSVVIDDYTVVSGPTGIGAYIVWHCTVRTLQGGDLEIRKRYSEFDQLREDLVRSFPSHAEAMIPKLPRKSVVSRFRPKFLEQRKAGLQQFLNCVLLNPEFAASPVVKEFIFS